MIAEIKKIDLFSRPGNSGIQPAGKTLIYIFFLQKSLINKYYRPLPTLPFVAGNGITEFYLERVVIGAFSQVGRANTSLRFFIYIGQNIVVKIFLLVGSEGRRIG